METPLESVVRETFEETGIQLKEITYAGNVIFKSSIGREGMYLFTAELPEGTYPPTPLATAEGILEWKPVDWILHKDNRGVAANLKAYLPAVLDGRTGLEHLFTYEQGAILDYTTAEIIETEVGLKYSPPINAS